MDGSASKYEQKSEQKLNPPKLKTTINMSGCLSKYTRYISADTASRREEIEGQIKKSLEDIEENNETVRRLKRLNDEKLDQILITQSCQARSNATSTAGETTSTNEDPGRPSHKSEANIPYEPKREDFLSVQSCLSGQKSVRDVFIPYLAEQIKNSSKNDSFEGLVKTTIRLMKKESPQIPIVKSTLGGRVCLKDHVKEEVLYVNMG